MYAYVIKCVYKYVVDDGGGKYFIKLNWIGYQTI